MNEFMAVNMTVECADGSKIKEPKPLPVMSSMLTDEEAEAKYRCALRHTNCAAFVMLWTASVKQ